MRAQAYVLILAAGSLLSACAALDRGGAAIPGRPGAPGAHGPSSGGGDGTRDRPPNYSFELACLEYQAIDKWERRYRTRPQEWRGHLDHPQRGVLYFAEIQRLVDAAGLPPELAHLPTIESGYRVDARGRGGRGLWQLGAATARRYGLVVHANRDDRLNPWLSTEVALRHLRYLHGRYLDWPLALAAYNAGEGRIDRARRANPGADYWELAARRRLPAATCAYVPKLLALARVAGPADCASTQSTARANGSSAPIATR